MPCSIFVPWIDSTGTDPNQTDLRQFLSCDIVFFRHVDALRYVAVSAVVGWSDDTDSFWDTEWSIKYWILLHYNRVLMDVTQQPWDGYTHNIKISKIDIYSVLKSHEYVYIFQCVYVQWNLRRSGMEGHVHMVIHDSGILSDSSLCIHWWHTIFLPKVQCINLWTGKNCKLLFSFYST